MRNPRGFPVGSPRGVEFFRGLSTTPRGLPKGTSRGISLGRLN